MHSSSRSSSYSCSPASYANGEYNQASSWGTVPTPLPGTPYPTTVPLPVCCPSGHPLPLSYAESAIGHPALQLPYNATVPPQLEPYSSEPATHPPAATLMLRLTPHPNTQIPFMDVVLSSSHSTPLTVHDVHVLIHRILSRQITHSDLRGLTERAADAASSAFHARTANDPNAFAQGMCMGDRMGGAWCVVGVAPSSEPGVWEVKLDVPRRR